MDPFSNRLNWKGKKSIPEKQVHMVDPFLVFIRMVPLIKSLMALVVSFGRCIRTSMLGKRKRKSAGGG